MNPRRSEHRRKNLHFESLEVRAMLSAQPFSDEFLVNDLVIRTQSIEQSSSALVATEANRVVVFEGKGSRDRQGVFAEVLNLDGGTLKASFQVNSTLRGNQHSPAVAADASGNFVVVWAGRGAGDKQGVFLQRFDAIGNSLGEESLVNSTTGGLQTKPDVAMAADGSFMVTWEGTGTGDVSGIFLRRYDANGASLGSEALVNTSTDDHQSSPSIAFDSTGNAVVAWQSRHQDSSDWGVYGQWLATDGSRIGGESLLSEITADSQTTPDVSTDPTGGVVVAWQSRNQDGDSWGVVAREFDSNGQAVSSEVVLNDQTAGHQQDVAIAVAEDGQWFAAWTSGVSNGSGWEVVTRSFEADGSANASERVNRESGSIHSAHQKAPAVALQGDDAIIIWTGAGREDHQGISAQNYTVDLVDDEPQQSPDLAPIADTNVEVGNQIEIIVTATDPNSRDTLTFFLDFDDSPTDATLEQIDNNSARIRWTPDDGDEGQAVSFRVFVTDDGNQPLVDSEDFTVTVGDLPLSIDLNGPSESGRDAEAEFVAGTGPVNLVSETLAIQGADSGTVAGATVRIAATPDGSAELLSVDTSDSAITASYDSATRTLSLAGSDTAANYEQVLRTLTYNNTSTSPSGDRLIAISISGSGGDNTAELVSVSTVAPNLVAFAEALADSGAKLFGAAWCPACTAQKELFEDGSQFLPFVEVTNPDRSSNQVGIDNNITVFPTWVFADGTRLEGQQSLQAISDQSGVAIPTSDQPFLASLPNENLLVGSPLHLALDGYDPNGGPLTYTVTSDRTDVSAEILSGNRSARVNVAGFGDLVFELFEQRAPRATEQMIDLADDDFYQDIIFHRIINGFVIQGGDPTGTGSGGSTLDNFNDQFHPDLQHNRTGLLSMAKSTDDTNDSQFFITEGATRNLDFNHTIFGLLVEGESNREAISNTAVSGSRPVNDVVMEGIDIFHDEENAVLMLKAADGATGSANITVTVTDQNGNSFDRTFRVDLAADTSNGTPYLGDIAPVSVASNTTAEVQLTSVDVEGDPVFYTAQRVGSVNYSFSVSETGLLNVTPPTDFVGTIEIVVGVGRVANSPDDLQRFAIEFS